jgi:hypothetical protein
MRAPTPGYRCEGRTRWDSTWMRSSWDNKSTLFHPPQVHAATRVCVCVCVCVYVYVCMCMCVCVCVCVCVFLGGSTVGMNDPCTAHLPSHENLASCIFLCHVCMQLSFIHRSTCIGDVRPHTPPSGSAFHRFDPHRRLGAGHRQADRRTTMPRGV